MNNFLLTLLQDLYLYFEPPINFYFRMDALKAILQTSDDELVYAFIYKTVTTNSLDYSFKLALSFFCLNSDITTFFFLKVTPVTFWMLPSVILFLTGIFTFLMLEPSSPNTVMYKFANFFFKIVFIYQFALLYMYVLFAKNGCFLKVGLNAFYSVPINFDLMKLLCVFFCFFLLILTMWLTDYYFWLTRNIIKPEIYSIVCFLGASVGMVFLQSDLFSIFLYMEMISFCLYAFLFLQKWTIGQLQVLIWYVLFSMWATTFYVIGIVLFLAHKQHFLESLNFLNLYPSLETFDSMPFMAILFFIFYFLFKIGAGPFYVWVVDVYSSSSIILLSVISILPKIIFLPLMYFILTSIFTNYLVQTAQILFVFGIITTFIGSFGIIGTTKLKEIYAWSSIVHTGNLLCLLSCTCLQWSLTAFFVFYLFSYCITSLAFLLVLMSFRNKKTGFFIKDINELAYISTLKFLVCVPLILFFSILTGFTPFVIFFMKFVLLVSVGQIFGILPALIIGLFNILGAFAYLRILRSIIGNGAFSFKLRKNNWLKKKTIINMPYPVAILLNLCLVYMIFGFFVLLEMISLFYIGPRNTAVDNGFCYTIADLFMR